MTAWDRNSNRIKQRTDAASAKNTGTKINRKKEEKKERNKMDQLEGSILACVGGRILSCELENKEKVKRGWGVGKHL
jgi:hypothetical protein